MRLFGGFLPFIGFRTAEVDEDMRRIFNIPAHVRVVETFEVEWFGYGAVLLLRPDNE